ncbi:MAG: RNA polymerase sigma factor [Candidatus Cloacimonetes bacterium]|nr:RNA polymerase sigma factor [Candidatus Cloacimonadota bacterium]
MDDKEEKLNEEIYHIKRAKKDIKDFDYLYRKYYPKINNYVYHRVYEDSIRQEIVSNVFFKAMKKLHMFTIFENKRSSFSAWLFRIAMSELNQYFRDRKRDTRIGNKVRWNYLPDDEDDIPERVKIKFEPIRQKMQDLNQEEQDLLTLRFFEKMRYKEIAQVYKKKETAIKVRIHRIMKKLRQSLEGEYNEDI